MGIKIAIERSNGHSVRPNTHGWSGISGNPSTPVLKRIQPYLQSRRYQHHEFIFREGSVPAGLYAVLQGEVKLTRGGEGGHTMILHILRPGQVFGYTGCMEECGISAVSAQAVGSSLIGVVPCAQTMRLMATDPALRAAFMKLMSQEVASLSETVVELAYKHVADRLASFLLSFPEVPTLTREEIAEAVGTSTETAIRVLSQFTRQGWIRKLDEHRIVVVNPEGLRHRHLTPA